MLLEGEADGKDLRVQARAEPTTLTSGEAEVLWVRGGSGSSRVGGRRRGDPVLCHPPPPGTQARGTGLTAVVVQEDSSDVVEARLAHRPGVLEVLLNSEVLSFAEQSWMDLNGEWQGRGPAQWLVPGTAGLGS